MGLNIGNGGREDFKTAGMNGSNRNAGCGVGYNAIIARF
jgi:hypothetical protein